MKTKMSISRVLSLLVMLLAWLPATSFAVSCWAANSNAIITEALGTELAVPADAPDGTIIWESKPRIVNVLCADDQAWGAETIYFYLNPLNVDVGTGIRVGIRYQGTTITQSSGKVSTGHHSHEGCTWLDCHGWNRARFSLMFSVFVEKYGPTPASGQATTRTTYNVFQLDGVWKLNIPATNNLNYVLTGLDKVRFVPCSPQLTVTPGTVDFGEVYGLRATVGSVAASKSVNLNLQRACTTPYTVNARFTPTAGTVVNGLLVPQKNDSVGISILRSGTQEKLAFNDWFKLTDMSGSTPASINLDAQLVWRKQPVVGPFNGAVAVELYYK
ncbi:hypothetical protein LMG19083_01319 [Ralstonia psammae]|uniref:Fimbrial-type adhesion domain-containing protein n=1 Tax=Ralstonia psammae TaxID=3058598 RepID=A0ABM9J821_9RALS|nr:hypothetical protein [Ralstonia sp. LMG 19083]CAJ0785583.1 hypothetical protein LMG19083_01319 [Ralstonia sp. LMG 19083]